MLRVRLFTLVVCFLFLTGCATFIEVQIKRAPELNLGEVKTLKIEPFDISGRLSLDLGESHHGGAIVGALVGMAMDAGANKIAERSYPALQQGELAGLKEKVFKDGFYKVNEAGDFDARITGLIHFTVTDSGESKSYQDKNGKNIYYYELTRQAQVSVKFTVLDNAGTVVGATEVTSSASQAVKDDNRERARNAAPAWDELVRQALTYTEEPFIRKIAPYFVTERRVFENGESEAVKEGNKAARNGDWEMALQYWKDGEASGKLKDRIAVTYNEAIYEEVQGHLAAALSKFEEVKKISGDAKYLTDIRRTQERIDEDKQLRSISASDIAPESQAGGSEVQVWQGAPGIRVTREQGMHQFSWNPLTQAAGYRVMISKGKGKPFSQLNHKLLLKPQLRAKALPRGKTLVQVVAVDQQGHALAKTTDQIVVLP